MKILTELRTLALGLEPVGSRVTCDPPVLNTDEDYLVLVAPEAMPDVHMALLRAEFALDGSNTADAVSTVPEEDRFQSFSNDTVNIILTRSPKFFRRFMAATYVARRLNLRVKGDRIALFQAVLYGNADSGGGPAHG